MLDRERLEPVVVALERVARPELHELERVAEPAEDPPQAREELLEARRAVDRERGLASAQGERLQHPRQAEEVVGVVVREEDLAQLDEADVGAQQLALRPLGAVEQEPLAAAAHERGRGRTLRGRHRARGAEEDDVEIHARILRGM